MNILTVSIKTVYKHNIVLDVATEFKKFNLYIEKENITYEDILNRTFYCKLVFMARNCCSAFPITIDEGTNDKPEIKELLDQVFSLLKADWPAILPA